MRGDIGTGIRIGSRSSRTTAVQRINRDQMKWHSSPFRGNENGLHQRRWLLVILYETCATHVAAAGECPNRLLCMQ